MSASIRKRLDAVSDAYWLAYCKLAAEVRASHVVPYCDRVGARFVSGMGGYTFTLKDGTTLDEWHGRDIPSYLRIVLDSSCVQSSTCIGAYMNDYTPEGWEQK